MTATCGYPKDDGSSCGSTVALCPDCGECVNHCEHRAETIQAARAKGGTAIKRKKEAAHQTAKAMQYRPAAESPPPPTTAGEAKDYLAWLLDAGTNGKMGGSLAKDMSQVADRFIKAVGVADHEARIKALEAAAEEVER